MKGLKLHIASALLLVLNIGLVMGLFRLVESRETAGLIAGGLFLAAGTYILGSEKLWGRGIRSVAFWTALAFLILAAVPIMGLRLANPGAEFADLSLVGVPGPLFHKFSSWFFLLMIGGCLVEAFRDIRGRSPTV